MPDRKPPAFDVAIIGAGPAGMAAAHRARECGLSVVQFEARDVGGTSVNRGCVAKRLLVTASRQGDAIRLAEPFGWSAPGDARFEWPGLRDVVRDRVAAVSAQRAERLEADGVMLVPRRVRLAGNGRIVARFWCAIFSRKRRPDTSHPIRLAGANPASQMPVFQQNIREVRMVRRGLDFFVPVLLKTFCLCPLFQSDTKRKVKYTMTTR